MDKELLLTKDQLKVPCILTEPEGGAIRRVVLGVHGLGGSARDSIQEALAEEMVLFDSAVLRFDFPAHGQSPLESDGFQLDSCRNSLLAAAEYAADSYGQVEDLCIFATGFGAYITLLCLEELLELPGNIKLVLHTPSVLMHDALLAMGQMNRATFQALGQIRFRAERPLTVSYSFYEDMQENIALTSYPLPFLILHGEADNYIPMAAIQNLRRLNERSKLVVIPGVGHRFLEDGAWDMVLDLTRDWFSFEQVLVCDWE